MSKYQKALDSICGRCYKDTEEHKKVLQELIDKETPSNLEECVKEWKTLGYEFKYDQKLEHIFISSLLAHLEDKHIHIFLKDSIRVMFSEYGQFTTQELELLTKTIKALGRL